MSDSSLDFHELLRFDAENGRILYGEERLLLLTADAVGRLRRELYDVLGPIMAHELLFRFGFHHGSRAAEIVRASLPGAPLHELLLAGPRIHSFEGMARVRVTDLRYGDAFECMSGVWEDSFEVEQSLSLWGEVQWTACWILTGYASGYASEILDRDLLCIERSCRARGDDECRFEVLAAERFPGLARKVRALREGTRFKERMEATIRRLSENAYTSSTFLSQILHDSADAILIVDETETIRTFNRGAEDLLGYRAEEAIGRHFGFLVPKDLLDQGEIEKIQQETVMHGSLRNYETRRLARDGSEVDVSLTRTSIYDAQGNYIGASAILRDINERKRLVEQLIQAESLAEVGELAAQVAHEIKNPLAGISAAIQLLANTYPETDPRASVFKEILDHIRRLDNTVKSLLDFTRLYSPHLQRIELDMILDSTLTMLEGAEEFEDVTVEREFVRGAHFVLADTQLLIQVLLNLLINAAQAVVDDRRIAVRSLREDEHLVIEVEDRGPGIPPDVLKQVLRPFYTTKSKGTGLGLPIARKIIEAHGGTLKVESEVGRGTLVRIRLPAVRAPSEGRGETPFSPRPR